MKNTFRQFTRPKSVRKAITQAKSISKPIPKTISTPVDLPLQDLTSSPDESNQLDHSSAIYSLTFSSWPVRVGIKFLLASFCSTHRPQFINLLESFDLSQLRPEDLIILADYLRTTCSTERGFSHRGSLMDRVRLALLKAGDSGLDLVTMAVEIDMNPLGLAGRIKRKANGWLSIRAPNESDR